MEGKAREADGGGQGEDEDGEEKGKEKVGGEEERKVNHKKEEG